jgi:hypothetical protein
MAGVAATKTADALRAHGPQVLQTTWHGEQRLQMAPDALHQADNDPHKTGRAIDIVLDSQRPTEKNEAESLIQAFIDLQSDLNWEYLIYAKRAWDSVRAYHTPIPRTADPKKYTDNWARARYEHITPIHIQWSEATKNLDIDTDSFVQRLQQNSWADDALETLANRLVGTWSATIGDNDWNGIFGFTLEGGAWWSSDAHPVKARGRWRFTANEVTWTYNSPGDIRTFVIPTPLDKTDNVAGIIRPDGQGWFSMTKQ